MSVVDLLMLGVVTLASARVTRLLRFDEITRPLRTAVARRSGADGWWSYLFHCHWCLGFWVSAATVAPFLIWPTNRWLQACYFILAVAEMAPRILDWAPRNTGGE